MAAGKKKPVRWTIPDVKQAPPRALVAGEEAPASRRYPSAAEMMARGPETQAWLKHALRSIVQPAAVASALALGVTGCSDVGEILSQGTGAPPPVFGVPDATDKPASLTPIGAPSSPQVAQNGGGVVMTPLPNKPDPTVVPPCPLPPLGEHAMAGEPPAVTPTPPPIPPAHPPTVRGRIRPIRPAVPTPPPTPPPVPAVDPPTLDGDVAMVHPEPPPMPGGVSVVTPEAGGE